MIVLKAKRWKILYKRKKKSAIFGDVSRLMSIYRRRLEIYSIIIIHDEMPAVIPLLYLPPSSSHNTNKLSSRRSFVFDEGERKEDARAEREIVYSLLKERLARTDDHYISTPPLYP